MIHILLRKLFKISARGYMNSQEILSILHYLLLPIVVKTLDCYLLNDNIYIKHSCLCYLPNVSNTSLREDIV